MKKCLFTLLLFLAFSNNIKAYDFSSVSSSGQTLYYNIISESGKTVELIKCGVDAVGDIVIPESVNNSGITYTVTQIGEKAFEWCAGLTGTLSIPNSVEVIGTLAFVGCTGFSGALLLPASLNSIGESAFYGCSSLTGVLEFPESLTTIGKAAFYNCYGFSGSLIIPSGITSIKEHTFRGCSGFNGTLSLPDNLMSIEDYAFSGCSGFLGSLVIPNSTTEIGFKAFYGCSGFSGSLTLSEALTTIEQEAFYGCSGFSGSLYLPEALTSIGTKAFSGCAGFTGSLTIPSQISTIEADLFNNCSGLNGVLSFPSKVNTIKSRAFYGCSSISSIVVKATKTPPSLNESSFEGIASNTPLHVFCGLSGIYSETSNWNRFTNIIEEYLFTVTAVSADEELGSVQLMETPSCGNSCVFRVKAVPNDGYALEKWTLQGSNASISTERIYIDTIQEDRAIEAHFIIKTSSIIDLSVYPETAGTAEVTADPDFEFGNTITLTAVPNDGYEFERWLEDDETVSTEAIYSFVSEGDRTFVARFHKAQSSITAEADPPEGATFTGTGIYSFGETITLTVIPSNDFVFVCWKDENGAFYSDEATLTFTADIDRHFTALLYSLVNVDEQTADVHVFPNPTNGLFTIMGSGIEIITIYNPVGQIVYSEKQHGTSHHSIDLSKQPNGVYFMRLKTSSGMITERIIKQ